MVTLEDQARNLHEERIANSGQIGKSRASAFVHISVIPVAALLRRIQLPVAAMGPDEVVNTPAKQAFENGIDHRGRWKLFDSGVGKMYTHTGRNAVLTCVMELKPGDKAGIGQKWKFWTEEDDAYFEQFVEDALKFLSNNGVPQPAFMLTTIDNAVELRAHKRGRHPQPPITSRRPFHAEQLSCDQVFVEDYTLPAAEVARTTLNIIWNGLGFDQCPSYGKDGSWQGISLY
jgi:hypothetical protein